MRLLGEYEWKLIIERNVRDKDAYNWKAVCYFEAGDMVTYKMPGERSDSYEELIMMWDRFRILHGIGDWELVRMPDWE